MVNEKMVEGGVIFYFESDRPPSNVSPISSHAYAHFHSLSCISVKSAAPAAPVACGG